MFKRVIAIAVLGAAQMMLGGAIAEAHESEQEGNCKALGGDLTAWVKDTPGIKDPTSLTLVATGRVRVYSNSTCTTTKTVTAITITFRYHLAGQGDCASGGTANASNGQKVDAPVALAQDQLCTTSPFSQVNDGDIVRPELDSYTVCDGLVCGTEDAFNSNVSHAM